MVYCTKGYGKTQNLKKRYFVIVEEFSERIFKYAKENSLRAVPGPISRLVDTGRFSMKLKDF